MIHLGPGRESDLIQGILESARTGDLAVPPGDDAAVLADGRTVVTIDASVEGVHFRREWLSPEAIGWRATQAALSDLAAMGAEPQAVFASLCGTAADAEDGTMKEVGQGIRAAAEAAGAVLAGGDTTGSPGPLFLDIVAIGSTADPVLRSGAQPGDELWVTGPLGGAAIAVADWGLGLTPDPRHVAAYARPEPRFAAMAAFRATGLLTAGMDLSDGLVRDGSHLAAASGVGLEIDAFEVPLAPGSNEEADDLFAIGLALAGGEDYELLVTLRPGLDPELPGLGPVKRVGRVVEGSGVRILDRAGDDLPIATPPFDHFRGEIAGPS